MSWGDELTGPRTSNVQVRDIPQTCRLSMVIRAVRKGVGGEAAREELARSLAQGELLELVDRALDRVRSGHAWKPEELGELGEELERDPTPEEREKWRELQELRNAVMLAIEASMTLDATAGADEPESTRRLRQAAERALKEWKDALRILPPCSYHNTVMSTAVLNAYSRKRWWQQGDRGTFFFPPW